MINFTNTKEFFNTYSGSEKKKKLNYNNEYYLVKFPDPIREKNKNISYINNVFSEYIGSNIFKICGFDTQETLLGLYNYKGKDKIVCACKDFLNNQNILLEFDKLALSTNPDKKIDTELNDIIETINESKKITGITDITDKFYDMFIIDALIGNTDRHNGNWGFILNNKDNTFSFSKIYDCGSCLNPLLDDKDISLLDDNEIKNLAINCYSCIKVNNQKINYYNYITSLKDKECNKALLRIFNNIELNKIKEFILNIECISNIRKNFYISIIEIRYKILKNTYKKLLNK